MTQDEAVQLLRTGKAGVKEWNERRRAGEKMPDLTGADLSHAQLAGIMLAGAQLSNADLTEANLSDADLTGADLIFVRLGGAILRDARLSHAHLIAADLSGANLSGADLSSSQLIKAHLTRADCTQAKLGGADLSQADLSKSDCTNADLSKTLLVDANLTDTVLKSANLEQAAVMGVKFNRRKLSCRGIRADSCYGHAVFKRDILDQDWIETFRAQDRRHYWMYVLWLITTDCGRSMTRVATWAITLAMAFGLIYTVFPTTLDRGNAVDTFWTPFYFSAVTFTTLGFGDVTPGSLAGQLIVTLEVGLGYITLGILVSILANKVARRS